LTHIERLLLAVAAFDIHRTPGRVRKALTPQGLRGIDSEINPADRRGYEEEAERLAAADVDVVEIGDTAYPRRLVHVKGAPPLLFFWGNPELLNESGVGMCGSRNVSPRGLQAARTCGLEVADHGLVIISGYAKGVDTETHLAALRSGGRTVIVLAEGINGFKRKRAFSDVPFDRDHVVAISQFAPGQRWNVGAAMTRNSVIAGLGRALVVIEAGETGGTLNAGLRAIDMGRPVLALSFSTQVTPLGNQALFEKGAIPIRSPQHLVRVLDAVSETPVANDLMGEQLSLLE
jgi:DNA processing protein